MDAAGTVAGCRSVGASRHDVLTTDRVPTLREIVDYHAYDDAWVPDMLAGATMDQAGRGKFDEDLLGTDPKAAFAAIVDTACAAAARVEQWRAIGVFPAAVPVPDSAPLLDRLLGITGRPPTSP